MDATEDMEAEVKVVSAPSLEDLQPSAEESLLFEKLIEWQTASSQSTLVLGRPVS